MRWAYADARKLATATLSRELTRTTKDENYILLASGS
jgi:hypothetical protein